MNDISETPGLRYVLESLKRAADNSECWPVYPAESGLILAEIDRLRAEAEQERAAVVVFLRGQQEAAEWALTAAGYEHAADAIERGEHRREEQE